MKSKNHKIWHDIIISCVEAMKKFKEGSVEVLSYAC